MAKFLTLTDKCNCFCTFCYEISPTGEPHVFVAELDALKEEMRQAMHVEGWNDIVITGGEPTITRTFLPVVAHAREIGFEMRAVATNRRRFSYEPSLGKRPTSGLTKHGSPCLTMHAFMMRAPERPRASWRRLRGSEFIGCGRGGDVLGCGEQTQSSPAEGVL